MSFNVFSQFKSRVRKNFDVLIKTLYTNNGGDLIKLWPYLVTHSVNHLNTPKHAPKRDGTEHNHKYVP